MKSSHLKDNDQLKACYKRSNQKLVAQVKKIHLKKLLHNHTFYKAKLTFDMQLLFFKIRVNTLVSF